ncbi:hypothetical protein [Butyrivibrio sp. NC2002]|uniref:hypothetical protein n=1 Tax=Butyrivibrio sp. NC2002 TaxID=1410610 RepID=UPI00055C8E30|nr:hypothetical protein [Butyrivibrio sp. NC2002]
MLIRCDEIKKGKLMTMYPPVHKRTEYPFDYDRLTMLWDKYPQYHEKTLFSTMDELLEEHESYRKDYEEVKDEYISCGYEKFLIQLSWADLPYRYETKRLIEKAGDIPENYYVKEFMDQFRGIDTERKACFVFPESFVPHFFVVMEVCKNAESVSPIKSLFPDEEKVHYLAVFDKTDMDRILLMYHLLYTSSSEEIYGGYSLYDYPFPWYHNHLWDGETVFRSPYLPDKLAKYQGNIPYYHNPAKTVYVRRNIKHMLECGYFSTELEFFLALTRDIMPIFQWWYTDILLYEEKDGFKTDWRLKRTQIRTDLTDKGIIKPKWKHELSLFREIRKKFPDTLYQYRPDWLKRQSLDIYIPSIKTGIEYQGIQHYQPVDFFGGEEALLQRQELDKTKKYLCDANDVRLIEWPYSMEPTIGNIKKMLKK